MATTLPAATLAANLAALYAGIENAITTNPKAQQASLPQRRIIEQMACDTYVFARADGTVTHAQAVTYVQAVVAAYMSNL